MDMTNELFPRSPYLAQPLDAERGAMLIEAVGNQSFGETLLDIANATSEVDELFGYMVTDGQEPQPIVSESKLPGASDRVAAYLKRFYQHDPAVREISQIEPGESFVQRISLGTINLHDYKRQCFNDPGFTEKLSFGWRGKGYLLVLSFYHVGDPDEDALTKLAILANLALATMVRHHAPVDPDNVVDVIERRLGRSFPELPLRERQVCARSLAGQSAKDIGFEFGISPGTVLTYRQRAYSRTGFSGTADFLPFLLN
jgi:DNA-binding CsgD family transcriptional regulator